MADGKTINLYNSSQYIERIDTQNIVYNNGKVDTPSEKADKLLMVLISDLVAEGKDGRELLSPYASAFMHGYAKKMNADEFNKKYGATIKPTTFNNWMSPVFNDEEKGKYVFTPSDLQYYDTKFDELKTPHM